MKIFSMRLISVTAIHRISTEIRPLKIFGVKIFSVGHFFSEIISLRYSCSLSTVPYIYEISFLPSSPTTLPPIVASSSSSSPTTFMRKSSPVSMSRFSLTDPLSSGREGTSYDILHILYNIE